MPELIELQGKDKSINIVEGIGVKLDIVGTILLEDKDGNIIPALTRQYGNDAELINLEILRRWLQGRAMRKCTWRVLLGVLRKAHCVELAESVEEALIAEEAEQGKSNSHPAVGIVALHLSTATAACRSNSLSQSSTGVVHKILPQLPTLTKLSEQPVGAEEVGT